MGQLRTAVIKRCLKRDLDPKRPKGKQKWCLYTRGKKKGKRRLLGRHPSKESALKQEQAIQVHKHGIVKYMGAYYMPVQALKQQFDPNKSLPQQGGINEAVSAQIYLTRLAQALQAVEKIFDALAAVPEMQQYDDKRKQIDVQLTEVGRTASVLKSLLERMGDKLEEQQETIGRFQNALKQLQSQRTSSVRGTNSMAREETPQMVKYAGHFYVLAEDEEEPLDVEEEETEEDEHLEEELEEMELLDALKSNWQTILDKLPDDLKVDDEFEDALNGIDEVISVMEKIHEEYADERDIGEMEDLPEEVD